MIQTNRLTKYYGKRIGVDQLTLSVPQGQIFGFLGPNGAGKSTTIRLLLGLLKPTEGDATVMGHDCWRSSHLIKADLGYLPGDVRLYSWLTGRLSLSFLRQLTGQPLESFGEKLAARFDFDLELRVEQMSRGNRQKLGLILALVRRPKLLVLDEPSGGLDPLVQQSLYDYLRGAAANGDTVFFSSHTLGEVERLCDRVVILKKGRLVADETVHDLRAKARRQVTIAWSSAAAAEKAVAPKFLQVYNNSGATWSAHLSGSAQEFASWVSSQPVADFSIGQPDLTDVFQGYYEQSEPVS